MLALRQDRHEAAHGHLAQGKAEKGRERRSSRVWESQPWSQGEIERPESHSRSARSAEHSHLPPHGLPSPSCTRGWSNAEEAAHRFASSHQRAASSSATPSARPLPLSTVTRPTSRWSDSESPTRDEHTNCRAPSLVPIPGGVGGASSCGPPSGSVACSTDPELGHVFLLHLSGLAGRRAIAARVHRDETSERGERRGREEEQGQRRHTRGRARKRGSAPVDRW